VQNHRLFRSSTFRLALLYLVLFGLSVLVLLVFIYWSTAGFMARQTDAAIEADIELLAERYQTRGLPGLTSLITERIGEDPRRDNLYLLADENMRRILGNLDGWPAAQEDALGWINFTLRNADDPENKWHGARARAFHLHGGFNLLVGRDMYELEAMRGLILETLAWGLAITLVLGLAGGIALSRSMVRRLETINVASREIMSGDLSRRIPVKGRDDEFDELVVNLNTMLDRITDLMDDVRRVSDSIAHDLKTPLTRLRNDLETLKSDTQDTPDARVLAERALEEADRLLETFNALLRIARIESGHRRAGFTAVRLADVLRDVTDLYEPLAEERGLTLERRIDASPTVRGDRDLLFQALANLLDNAIKYTLPDGRVMVTLSIEDGEAQIEIADSGPGIPEPSRDKVFRRFYRLEESRTAPGSGLGLSLVGAVIKLHEARIALEDNAPGLMVVLRLPLEPGAHEVSEATSPPAG
jgi:signal transduction histidine kinase